MNIKQISKIYKSMMLVCSAFVLLMLSCQQTSDKKNTTIKVIFDTDMGSDCDDAGALALLHKYADMGLVEIIGCIYSSGKVPYGAGITEAINIYYGRPHIPIGAYHGNEVGDPVDKMTAGKLVRDTAAFGNTIIHNTDAEEQTRLNRRLLSQAPDNSVTYITIGHTKALYKLLVSMPDDISILSGYELVSNKMQRWVALGALGANNPDGWYVKDWNFFFNNTAPYTQYLVENIPCPVYYVDAGNYVMTGKSLKTTPNGNIVRTVYRDWLWEVFKYTLDDQRPSWDLAAVYFAVNGTGLFLDEIGQGYLEFDTIKGNRWHNNIGNRNQYFIQQKQDADTAFAAYLNKLIAEPPKNHKNLHWKKAVL